MLERYSVSRCCCAAPAATCALCSSGTGPQQWSFTLSGAVPVYSILSGGITDNDLDSIVAAVNATHSVSYIGPCTWRTTVAINGEFGDVYEVRLSVFLTNSHPVIGFPNNGFILELEIDDVDEPPTPNTGNAKVYWGNRTFWDKEISSGSTFDCGAAQSLAFAAQEFELIQTGIGYVDSTGLTAVTVNPI